MPLAFSIAQEKDHYHDSYHDTYHDTYHGLGNGKGRSKGSNHCLATGEARVNKLDIFADEVTKVRGAKYKY